MIALLRRKVIFKGKALRISKARMPKQREESVYIEGATKVFVGDIPRKVTLEEFEEFFSKYGAIQTILLPLADVHKKTNRGHGFVNFAHTNSVKEAIEDQSGTSLRGKIVR